MKIYCNIIQFLAFVSFLISKLTDLIWEQALRMSFLYIFNI